MASVFLDFIPPQEPDIATLRIYEGSSKDGPFITIEEVEDIGTYPNYITQYTTTLAINEDDWFVISWINTEGAELEASQPMQGGVTTLGAIIKNRIQSRDSSIPERVAFEEAKTVIEEYFGTIDVDPDSVSQRVLSGLTFLAMARSYIGLSQAAGSVTKFTAGLVSMQGGDSSASKVNFDWLFKEASKLLGISGSRVAQIVALPIAGGMSRVVRDDISRLLVEIE
jgi:hypothetical protein